MIQQTITAALIRPRGAVLLAFVAVGLMNATYILNHFLVWGAYLLDAGLFAGMLESRGGLRLSLPYALSEDSNFGFWATHFSPTLLLAPALHALLQISPVTWLAIVLGFIYGLLALGICWLLTLQMPASFGALALCVCGALAFSFSRLVLSAVNYPHFEFLFVALIPLFGIAHYYGKVAISFVLLTLAIGIREDCGFHFFAIAATYLALIRMTRPFTRAEWLLVRFALYALCWSILAMAAQRAYFPGDDALARVYTGSPPMAHLTSASIAHRLVMFAAERYDILLMWGWLVALAALTRSIIPLAGFLAFLPWTFLNLLAVTESPPKLELYYGFPLALGVLWPLLHRLWQHEPRSQSSVEALTFIAMAIIVAIVGAGPHERHALRSMLSPRWVAMSGTREFARWLETGNLREKVFLDPSVAALAPWRVNPQQLLSKEAPPEDARLIVYNPRYQMDKASTEAKIDAIGLTTELKIPQSELVVRSAMPIDGSRLRDALFK